VLPGNSVPDLHSGLIPDGDHDPRPVDTNGKRQAERWDKSAADVGVHQVDPGRLHLDDDLVALGFRNRPLFDAQHLGGTVFRRCNDSHSSLISLGLFRPSRGRHSPVPH
jgi:hypothetical protein